MQKVSYTAKLGNWVSCKGEKHHQSFTWKAARHIKSKCQTEQYFIMRTIQTQRLD